LLVLLDQVIKNKPVPNDKKDEQDPSDAKNALFVLKKLDYTHA
jgi:hypothetical protein